MQYKKHKEAGIDLYGRGGNLRVQGTARSHTPVSPVPPSPLYVHLTRFQILFNISAWTDTDDTEGTKESGESSDQTKDTATSEKPMKGSLISVQEADEANRGEIDDKMNQSETNGVHEAPQTTDTEVPQTTDTEGVNGTETDSLGSMESGGRRRIKRNAVVPTDAEDSSRQTDPEVESRKGTHTCILFNPALSKCVEAVGSISGVVGSKCQVPLPARGLLVKSSVELAASTWLKGEKLLPASTF